MKISVLVRFIGAGLAPIVGALCSLMSAVAAPPGEIRSANALGPAGAPVTIEFFSDLQCPQCARYEPVIKAIQTEFKGKVRLLVRHFPLQEHENALMAAYAAEAAAAQGHFWQMIEALYRTQWMWGRAPAPRSFFRDQAKSLGLDLDQFEKDMDSPETHQRIAEDQDRGATLGVKTTPTIIINGYNVPNSEFNENGFRAAIKAALAKAEQ
jgi:protein-disulfide isomerase